MQESEDTGSTFYDEIIQFFRFQIEELHKIEKIKVELANHQPFELFETFSRFDCQGKGFVHRPDIINFVEENGYEISKQTLDVFVRSLDDDNDGCIEFSEFNKFLLPRFDEDLSATVFSRNLRVAREGANLDNKIEKYVCYLIKIHSELEEKCLKMMGELAKKIKFEDKRSLFQQFDQGNKGFFDVKDLFNLMRDYDISENPTVAVQLFTILLPSKDMRVLDCENFFHFLIQRTSNFAQFQEDGEKVGNDESSLEVRCSEGDIEQEMQQQQQQQNEQKSLFEREMNPQINSTYLERDGGSLEREVDFCKEEEVEKRGQEVVRRQSEQLDRERREKQEEEKIRSQKNHVSFGGVKRRLPPRQMYFQRSKKVDSLKQDSPEEIVRMTTTTQNSTKKNDIEDDENCQRRPGVEPVSVEVQEVIDNMFGVSEEEEDEEENTNGSKNDPEENEYSPPNKSSKYNGGEAYYSKDSLSKVKNQSNHPSSHKGKDYPEFFQKDKLSQSRVSERVKTTNSFSEPIDIQASSLRDYIIDQGFESGNSSYQSKSSYYQSQQSDQLSERSKKHQLPNSRTQNDDFGHRSESENEYRNDHSRNNPYSSFTKQGEPDTYQEERNTIPEDTQEYEYTEVDDSPLRSRDSSCNMGEYTETKDLKIDSIHLSTCEPYSRVPRSQKQERAPFGVVDANRLSQRLLEYSDDKNMKGKHDGGGENISINEYNRGRNTTIKDSISNKKEQNKMMVTPNSHKYYSRSKESNLNVKPSLVESIETRIENSALRSINSTNSTGQRYVPFYEETSEITARHESPRKNSRSEDQREKENKESINISGNENDEGQDYLYDFSDEKLAKDESTYTITRLASKDEPLPLDSYQSNQLIGLMEGETGKFGASFLQNKLPDSPTTHQYKGHQRDEDPSHYSQSKSFLPSLASTKKDCLPTQSINQQRFLQNNSSQSIERRQSQVPESPQQSNTRIPARLPSHSSSISRQSQKKKDEVLLQSYSKTLIQILLDTQNGLEVMRSGLASAEDFNISSLFEHIDIDFEGAITKTMLYNYLEERSIETQKIVFMSFWKRNFGVETPKIKFAKFASLFYPLDSENYRKIRKKIYSNGSRFSFRLFSKKTLSKIDNVFKLLLDVEEACVNLSNKLNPDDFLKLLQEASYTKDGSLGYNAFQERGIFGPYDQIIYDEVYSSLEGDAGDNVSLNELVTYVTLGCQSGKFINQG